MNDRPTIVVLGFRQTFEKDPATGRMDKPVDWVTYAPIHAVQSSKVEERIDQIKPPAQFKNDREGKKMAFMRYRWAMIEKAYNAWKEGVEIPLDGTPLGVWPGINEAQANAFRAVGIRTIEGVRDMPDGLISKVALPGVRDLQRQAALFLEAKDAAAAASKQAESDSRIAALEEQLAAAMQLLEETTKPKRGRPPKVEEEVEEAA